MANEFIRIPPDSTGKRVRHVQLQDVEINNLQVQLSNLEPGITVTGNSSGTTGKFIGFSNDLGTNYIYVTDFSGFFTAGETISSAENGNIADVVGTQEIHTPSINISDEGSPTNTLSISEQGSAFVRFTEGEMVFDAFGHSQFTQPQVVAIHSYLYEDSPTKYFTDTRVGGEVSVNTTSSMLEFSTGTTSGSYAGRTTNQYYPYTPGEGNELIISFMAGDTGKQGVVRRWGLFDDKDGLFFELSGSVFSVNQRSSASGTVTNRKVIQSEFNGQRLESIDTGQFILDNSKLNLFWIDYQWLGVGKVRFGVYGPRGQRIILHTFENSNNGVLPWAKRGTLPMRLEQFNETTVGSTSEMKIVCAAIIRQGVKESYEGNSFHGVAKRVPISGSGHQPIISFRPVQEINGNTNRILFMPVEVETLVEGDALDMHVNINANLTGSTFSAPTQSLSSVQIDTDATGLNGGQVSDHLFFSPNQRGRRLVAEDIENAISLTADGQVPTYTLSAQTQKPSGSALISVIVRWKEVK